MKQKQTGVVEKEARVQNRIPQGSRGRFGVCSLVRTFGTFRSLAFWLMITSCVGLAASSVLGQPAQRLGPLEFFSGQAGLPPSADSPTAEGLALPVGCPEPLLVLPTLGFLFQPPRGSTASSFPGRCSGLRALRCPPRSEGHPGEEK